MLLVACKARPPLLSEMSLREGLWHIHIRLYVPRQDLDLLHNSNNMQHHKQHQTNACDARIGIVAMPSVGSMRRAGMKKKRARSSSE
jgi:hypothetical protein